MSRPSRYLDWIFPVIPLDWISMRVKIEGIILAKNLFKERDLICRLLLRNGKQVSVLCYGGQGGGRRMKSSLIELGHLLSLEISRFRRNHQGMYSSREYSLVWHHRYLRKPSPGLLSFVLLFGVSCQNGPRRRVDSGRFWE